MFTASSDVGLVDHWKLLQKPITTHEPGAISLVVTSYIPAERHKTLSTSLIGSTSENFWEPRPACTMAERNCVRNVMLRNVMFEIIGSPERDNPTEEERPLEEAGETSSLFLDHIGLLL
jgi:hypothetical protein